MTTETENGQIIEIGLGDYLKIATSRREVSRGTRGNMCLLIDTKSGETYGISANKLPEQRGAEVETKKIERRDKR